MSDVTSGTYEVRTVTTFVIVDDTTQVEEVMALPSYRDPGSALAQAREMTAKDGLERRVTQVQVTSTVYAVVRR